MTETYPIVTVHGGYHGTLMWSTPDDRPIPDGTYALLRLPDGHTPEETPIVSCGCLRLDPPGLHWPGCPSYSADDQAAYDRDPKGWRQAHTIRFRGEPSDAEG